MMYSFSKGILAAGFSLMLLCAAGSHGARAEEKTVTMSISSYGLYYMLHYVAEGAGLFEKEGLKLDMVEVQSGSQQAASVMGGSAIATPVNIEGAILSTQQGGNLVAVGGLYNLYPMALVISNKAFEASGMNESMSVDDKVQRLKGLKIGITSPGGGADKFIRTVLSSRGIDPDTEVSLVPLGGVGPNQYAAFQNGTVDASVWSSPLPELAELEGIGTTIIDPFSGQKIEYDVQPYIVLTTTRDNLETNRDEIRGILRAYAQALNLIKSNPDEARRVVRAKFMNADEATFNAGFDKNLKALPTTLVIAPEQFETTIEAMRGRSTTPLDVEFEDVVDNELAAEVSKELLDQ